MSERAGLPFHTFALDKVNAVLSGPQVHCTKVHPAEGSDGKGLDSQPLELAAFFPDPKAYMACYT